MQYNYNLTEKTPEEELAEKRRQELLDAMAMQKMQQMQAQQSGSMPNIGMLSSFMGGGQGGGLSSMFGGGASASAGGAAASGGGAAAGGSAAAGGGSAAGGLAAFWPAAVVLAGIANETSAKKNGYRREGSDYTKDLITGKVLYQDVDQRWAPKLFGEKDSTGMGGDMRAAAALGGLDPGKAWKHFKEDSSIAKLFKKIF